MRNNLSRSIVSHSLSLLLATGLGALGACGGGGEGDEGDANTGPFITLDSIAPDRGPQSGGNVVTVTGSGFLLIGSERNQMLIGGALAEAVSVVSDTTVEVTMPASDEAGLVGITVFNGNGTAALGDVYTYNDSPVLEEIAPASASLRGGEEVTLTGLGFESFEAGANHVFFGDEEGIGVEVVDDTELTVTVPVGRLGSATQVHILNDNGASEPLPFRYSGSGLLAIGHSRRGGMFPAAPIVGTDGQIFFVDPVTQTIEETDLAFAGTDSEPINTCRGATQDDEAIYARVQDGEFARLDLADGTTEVFNLAGCSRIHAVESHQGVLYGFCRDNQNGQDFGRIDPVAKTFTPIGTNDDCCSMNLLSDGTTLFLLAENRIAPINPLNGVKGPEVTIGGNIFSVRGMAFHEGTMYGVSTSASGGPGDEQTFLVEIDPQLGTIEFVMSLGTGLRGLATSR